MAKKRVLLVGESWVTAATHYKGFDQFGSVTFHLGAEPLVEALKDSPFELDYMPAHEAAESFPSTWRACTAYDASSCPTSAPILSCCLPMSGCSRKHLPNRLKLISDWTAAGGGL